MSKHVEAFSGPTNVCLKRGCLPYTDLIILVYPIILKVGLTTEIFNLVHSKDIFYLVSPKLFNGFAPMDFLLGFLQGFFPDPDKDSSVFTHI